MAFKPKIITTEDGFDSLFSNEYQAAYHSYHGALEEANVIFINAGLKFQILQNHKKEIDIFEMGFGSGLNALLTALNLKEHPGYTVNYSAIELHPVDHEVIQSMNYGPSLDSNQLFLDLHNSEWENLIQITDQYFLHKIEADIHEFPFESESFDLIYFDAFAPSCQPQLWEDKLHQKIFNSLRSGGCLVSYCAKGSFKRTLKSVGYHLESLPGPGKKREITRAVKP